MTTILNNSYFVKVSQLMGGGSQNCPKFLSTRFVHAPKLTNFSLMSQKVSIGGGYFDSFPKKST